MVLKMWIDQCSGGKEVTHSRGVEGSLKKGPFSESEVGLGDEAEMCKDQRP